MMGKEVTLNINQFNLYSEIKNSIGSADTKLSIRTAIIIFIFSLVISLFQLFHFSLYAFIPLISLFSIELIITIIPLMSIFTNEIKNSKEQKHKNNYYFGYIASFSDLIEYKKHSKIIFGDKSNDELAEQIYINSKILKRKYEYFNYSFVIIQLIRIAYLGIISSFKWVKRKQV